MRRLLAKARQRCLDHRDEAGLAMVIAVLAMLLMTLLPMIVFNDAMSQLPISRYDQDSQAALDAAQAGVQDLLNHLTTEPTYWSDTSAQSSNPAMGGRWETVPGNANGEQFTYALNTASTASQGIVYVESTGKSRNAIRTIYVGLRPDTFADYVYETDYEIIDPALSNSSCVPLHAYDWNSVAHQWGPSTTGNANCTIVYFAGGDTLVGRVDSNDELHVCSSAGNNAVFPQGAYSYFNTSSSQDSSSYQFGNAGTFNNDQCGGGVTWPPGTWPQAAPKLTVPSGTQSALRTAATANGCLFTGTTTTITIEGTSLVISSTGSTTGSTCNANGTISIPANGLIYATGEVYIQDNNSGVGAGNELGGDLTVAGADNITITGNLLDASTSGYGDMLGLVAFNDVEYGAVNNLTVQAAVLAQSHSIYLPNWGTVGTLGTLSIYGSLAQEFRGPVAGLDGNGNVAHGFVKDYQYDPRLQTATPPYFPTSVSSTWRQLSFREIAPCKTPLSGC
jgi:hypothetical protein